MLLLVLLMLLLLLLGCFSRLHVLLSNRQVLQLTMLPAAVVFLFNKNNKSLLLLGCFCGLHVLASLPLPSAWASLAAGCAQNHNTHKMHQIHHQHQLLLLLRTPRVAAMAAAMAAAAAAAACCWVPAVGCLSLLQ